MSARLPRTVRVAKLCSSLPPEKFDEVVRIVRDLEDELWAIRRGRDLILSIQDDPDEEPRPLGELAGAPWPDSGLEIVECTGDPETPIVDQVEFGSPPVGFVAHEETDD